MGSNNGYFQHPKGVIDFAYQLVKEYDDHEKEQDRIWRQANPAKVTKSKSYSKPGGMIKKHDV